MSYHNLVIWAPAVGINGEDFSSLPFGYDLTCTRTSGWELRNGDDLLGGEFDRTRSLRVAVKAMSVDCATVDGKPGFMTDLVNNTHVHSRHKMFR